MRVIIAGSRHIGQNDVYGVVDRAVRGSKFDIDEVVSGGARGVDSGAERWAIKNNIDLSVFYANWNRYGKFAGPRRNKRMASYADALIAIPYPDSKGTSNMIDIAQKEGLQVYIHREFL